MKKKIIGIFISIIVGISILFMFIRYRTTKIIDIGEPYSISESTEEKSVIEKKERIINEFKENKDKNNYKKDEVIVKVKDISNMNSVKSNLEKDNIHIDKIENDTLILSFDSAKETLEDVLLKLNAEVDIEYAEPDYIRKISTAPEAEPYYRYLWGLKNTTRAGIDINVESAWNVTQGNENVVVGILDSGIDFNHIDIKPNIWTNIKEIPNNGIDDDSNGYIDDFYGWDFLYNNNNSFDSNGHGSHIAGTIAAPVNNLGIVGVAPSVKVMALKVGDNEGYIYTSAIISAINYATKMGVKIFNSSYGGEYYSQAEMDAMKRANALFIAASGNGEYNGYENVGVNNDLKPQYPANYDLPNVISVASVSETGEISKFSNYGVTSVDIAAPGEYIFSTILSNTYSYYSGTSMAAPHVAGVAALLLSYKNDLTIADLRKYLLGSPNKLSSLNGKVVTGGMVNATGSLKLLQIDTKSTDIDTNGITDIEDLNIITSSMNAKLGDSNYSDKLDLNTDGIIDIYDFVKVSINIK